MKNFYIDEAARHDNQTLTSFFCVAQKSLREKKGGGQYLALTLSDRTGQIDARMWDEFGDSVATFAVGDFVKIRGVVSQYNGRYQLTLQKLKRAEPQEIDAEDYLPKTTRDVDAMWAGLRGTVESFKNPDLRRLVFAFLDDEAVAAAYKAAPAAKTLHHAWLGGLLEHVTLLVEICEPAARHYEFIDRDLLLTGAILHDIGKIRELSWKSVFEYTIEGQLVGHISIAIGMLREKIAGLNGFPERLRVLVEHMILSHHGKYEFGSPKLPMIPEALLLSFLDDMEAKMEMSRRVFAEAAANGRRPGEMTEWVRAMERPLLDSAGYLKEEEG